MKGIGTIAATLTLGALAGVGPMGGAGNAWADVGGDSDPDDRSDCGFYLGVALVGTSFTLDLDERATPTVHGFEFDEHGAGMEIFCGAMFSPRFRLEFGGSATMHDADPGDAQVAIVGARITGYVPLIPGRRLEPSILAGLGASGVAFAGDDFEDRFYGGLRGDLGVGLRLRLSRHQFLQAHFLHSIHDVEREFLEGDDDTDIRHVGGTAWTRTLFLGGGWDF